MQTKEKLIGHKIYLRKIEETDVNERYLGWLNNHKINRYLESRFCLYSMQDVLNFVKSKLNKGDELMFAICDIESNLHIGNIKLGPINPNHKHASIGIIVGEESFWGKGIATEAIKLITDYAFQTLNLNKLDAGVYADNVGSVNAFKKCGYLQEGLQRKHYVCGEKLMDAVLVGLTAEDYWNKK